MPQQDQIVSGSTTMTPWEASYHWRNKNCYPWSVQWFKSEIPGTSAEKEGNSAEITEVTEVDGDVDLGQRKGKVLTIYDCRVVMSWKGKKADGTELSGTVTVPEVSHEMIDGHDQYSYEFSAVDDSSFYSFLKSSLGSALTTEFNKFPKVLVETHGQPTSQPDSGTATPAAKEMPAAQKQAATATVNEPKKATTEKKELQGSTSSIVVETRLAASAEDLWLFLTDDKRVPMWTRAPAKVSPKVGSEFEMFGGNIRGKVLSAEESKKLVQSWQLRSPNWPSEHYATLTTTLSQGDDSTLVTWNLVGVPKGQEETLRGALEGYYVNGFKQIGLVISPPRFRIIEDVPSFRPPSSSSSKPTTSRSGKKKVPKKTARAASTATNWGWGDVLGYGLAAGSVVGFIGIVWGSFRQ